MEMTNSLKTIIADNVNRLMDYHGGMVGKERMLPGDLAKLCRKNGGKTDQKTIWNVVNPDKSGNITTATIESIAGVFNLEPYHLMIPNLPIEELTSRRLEKVIECYAQVTFESRENIVRIAENEVRYRTTEKTSINGG